MSGRRRGPDPKWGPMANAFPLRLPKELRTIAEDLAKERGMSANEFLMRAVAEQLGYQLPAPPRESQQEPLPLIETTAA